MKGGATKTRGEPPGNGPDIDELLKTVGVRLAGAPTKDLAPKPGRKPLEKAETGTWKRKLGTFNMLNGVRAPLACARQPALRPIGLRRI
jgi:hypothetical protein